MITFAIDAEQHLVEGIPLVAIECSPFKVNTPAAAAGTVRVHSDARHALKSYERLPEVIHIRGGVRVEHGMHCRLVRLPTHTETYRQTDSMAPISI